MGPASQEVPSSEPMRWAKSGSPSSGRCVDFSASPERLFVGLRFVSSFGTVPSVLRRHSVRLGR
ncbi:MAG TPA: hypothetical protein DCQ98_06850 [Planctomycetaceae bacterium]|nr:hypothetical protein [Planctomycetaceae bacterium]